jgi:hypothetical protein
MVESLLHAGMSEARGFETRLGERVFSICLILTAVLGPVVFLASNRNEYRKLKSNVLGSRTRPVRKAAKLTAICLRIV